jgi:hypothetical protein
MVVATSTKKVGVMIFSDPFIIKGFITVPTNMRFSDTLNKFLKEQQFLAITDAEISYASNEKIIEKKGFILINKDKIIGIAPSE